MPSTLWVKRRDNGRHQPGDVIDNFDGEGLDHGKKPTQSEDWRIIVVRDGTTLAVRKLGLFESYEPNGSILLLRTRHLDIEALEKLEETRRHRRLASDDILETLYMEDLARFTLTKALPSVPGVIG